MQIKAFILSFVLILSLIPQGVLANTQDKTPPTFESIEMIDTNVSTGNRVSFKVKVKDDLSGAGFIYAVFKSPSKKHQISGSLSIEKETEDNMYTVTTDAINAFAEEGTWYLSQLSVTDKAKNSFTQQYGYDYSYEEKPVVTFEVKNDSVDKTPPTFESIEMIDTNVNAGEPVSFKVKTKDDLSGVSHISASFISPSRKITVSGYLHIEKEAEDYVYTLTTYAINPFAQAGTWYLSHVYLIDNANNEFQQSYGYDYPDYQEKPLVTFEVKNDLIDTTPPTLESIEMIDTNVNVGDTVSFKVKAKDDLSGIRVISARFTSPSGKDYISRYVDILKETEDHVYTLTTHEINPFAEAGTWYLSSLSIADKVSNGFLQSYGYDSSSLEKPLVTFEVGEKEDDFKTWDPKYNVPLNKEWTVDFSLAFDIKTILSNNIYITDSAGKKVPLQFIIDRGADNKSSTLIIAPVDNYVNNTTYTLWIKDIYSQDGKKLSKNVKMQFTTK